ncbi:RidA family protein [Tunturibacter psychrotolerans]|uniref:RidA family protein n=1 Tax=Tunturiibacter psychrotolerans TaxID=3069686 RepID=A0AAU7ZJJ2_9BACT
MRFARLWILGSFVAGTLALAQNGAAARPDVQFKNSSDISSPAGYSHAVVVNSGKIVFLSGQVGLDKHGEMVGKDDFHAQVAQVFANLRSALSAAGATPSDLVKLNYYIVGLNHDKLVAIRDVRDQMINKEHPPASTLAGVQTLFREDALIEVEAVAVIP